MNRYYHIDILEIIAMLFVIIDHSIMYPTNFISNSNIVSYIGYYLSAILSTCVPLFFFANGYLLLNKEFNLRKHIFKIIRFAAIAVVWGAIDLSIICYINGEHLSVSEFVKILWKWDIHYGINVFWYLGALVCIYIWFPLIKSVYDNNRKSFIFFVSICAFLTFGNTLLNHIFSLGLYLIEYSSKIYNVNFFNMFNVFRGIFGYAFVYFCIGGLIKTREDYIRQWLNKRKNIFIVIFVMFISSGILSVTGILLSHMTDKYWDLIWNGYSTIPTFVNVICIYMLCLLYKAHNEKIRNGIKIVSTSTLGIYVMHMIFIKTTRNEIAGVIVDYSFVEKLVVNIMYAIAILIICTLITKLMKRIILLKKII